MKRLDLSSIDPYRVFFPIGLAHALLGTSVWILFAFGIVDYPAHSHPHQMVSGFLFSFALGFLMTAVPRFTGAARANPVELLLGACLASAGFFLNSYLLTCGLLSFLTVFFSRRLIKRSFSPPPHFMFIPLGLFLGLLGSILLSLVEFQRIDSSFAIPAKLFLYHGTMLCFLLGIGARLLAALLGWAPPPTHQVESMTKADERFSAKKWRIPLIQAGLFALGFLIEVTFEASVGRGLRAVVASWIAMQYWRLYRLPKIRSKLSFWIWISCWTLLIGLWTHALFPSFGVHVAHVIFIGGFGLMTLLVSSRVILAHGGFSLEPEARSRIYALFATAALLAMLTRFSAQWTSSLLHHYAYAAVLWILSLFLWGSFFLPKLFFGAKPHRNI